MTGRPRPVSPAHLTELLRDSLDLSSAEGARVVTLHWLHELMAARVVWAERAGAEALHADDDGAATEDGRMLHRFRVALRRLRLALREHRRLLDLKDHHEYQAALRSVNDVSDVLRDRDVRAAWLDANASGLSADARGEALAWQRRASDTATARDRRRLARACARHLDTHLMRLAGALSAYEARHVVGEDHRADRFSLRVAKRLDAGSRRIDRALARLGETGSAHQLHQLRMEFKRLRALLAPYVDGRANLRAYFDLLTAGQDALGEMRDATLFAALAERDTLTDLARVLRTAADDQLARFTRLWRVPCESRSSARDAACRALREVPASFDAAAVARTHGLPMEIERKFLLHGLPPHAASSPVLRIEQGWLPGTLLRERLRQSISASGDVLRTRTIKLGQPGARIEVEEPVAKELFDAMWPLTSGARILKRRHVVADAELTWEIDVFLDRDLVLAEVELRDVARAVEIPLWLAPFIVKDVTEDPAYLNAVMARHGMAAPNGMSR